jgi:serine/threonine protein kinase
MLYKDGTGGNGAYSRVYSAKDQLGAPVALKRNLIDNEITWIGTLRELSLLTHLRGHPHISNIKFISIGKR